MLPGLAGKNAHLQMRREEMHGRNGLAVLCLDGVLRDVKQRWRTLDFGPDGYR